MNTTLKKLMTHLGFERPSTVRDNGESPAGFYDACYRESEEYRKHYTASRYYFLWTVIVDRILHSGAKHVLEVGCGPGQLAHFLIEDGIKEYLGIDFSPVAIELALSKGLPRTRFEVADALETNIYKEFDYDVLVCTEVLEHVVDDLDIVARFIPGKRAICTVPNFPYKSHVRHFECDAQVAERYQAYFDDFTVRTFRGPRSGDERYFLFDGVRSPSHLDSHCSSMIIDRTA